MYMESVPEIGGEDWKAPPPSTDTLTRSFARYKFATYLVARL